MFCPKCKNEIPEKFKFCPECGSNISSISKNSAIEKSLGGINTISGKAWDLSVGSINTVITPGEKTSGRLLKDRYELAEEIGNGGFAVVYRAIDRKLGNREVAVKILKLSEHTDNQTITRFKAESGIIASLNHRNIVTVFDSDIEGDEPFIVMEYINSGNLKDYLKDKGKLNLDEALTLFRGICSGVAYAHRKNLVHRDLKPGNVMLTKDGNDLIPKIVDFGLARLGGNSDVSVSGYGMGTPFYMPPEQRRDAKSVNHTADIYALGKILYEMLTGEIPDNVDQKLIPKPDALSDIIFKCVKGRPEERYFSVDEIVNDVSHIKAGKSRNQKPLTEHSPINVCPSCSFENKTNAKYCASCGAGLYKKCPECGDEFSVSLKFCSSCGTDFDGFVEASEVLSKMEKYLSEKKWSRVMKEGELLPKDIKLSGVKGAAILGKISEYATTAEKNDKQLTKRNGQLSTLVNNHCYEKIDIIFENIRELSNNKDELDALERQIHSQKLTFKIKALMDTFNSHVVTDNIADAKVIFGEISGLLKNSPSIKIVVDSKEIETEALLTGLKKSIDSILLKKLDTVIKTSEKYLSDGKYAEAKEQLNKLIKAYPELKNVKKMTWVYANICATVKAEQERIKRRSNKRAIKIFTIFIAIVIIVVLLMCLEYKAETERISNMEKEKSVKISVLLSKAQTDFDTKKYAEASDAVRQILEIDRNNSVAEMLKKEISSAVGLSAAPIKSKAEMKYAQLFGIDKGQGIGSKIEETKLALDTAKTLFDKESYGEAIGKYQEVVSASEKVLKLDGERKTSVEKKTSCAEAKRKAEGAEASEYATSLWNSAKLLDGKALEKFNACEFAKSAELWESATAEFAKAEPYAKTAKSDTKKKIEDDSRQAYNVDRAKVQSFLADAKNNSLSDMKRCGAADSAISLLDNISSSSSMAYLSAADKSEIGNLKSETSSIKSKLNPGPTASNDWKIPGIRMEFVWIKALDCWIGKYEVTNGEYRKYKEGHDSKQWNGNSLNGDRHPVVYVNFYDATEYAKWLTDRECKAGRLPAGFSYRLPTEKEWTTFCQCGDNREYPWGNGMPPKYGNYCGQETNRLARYMITGYNDGFIVTCPVEVSGKNDWGLYGVGGNVWECTVKSSSNLSFDAVRGDSWDSNDPDSLRSMYRNVYDARNLFYGFRLVLSR